MEQHGLGKLTNQKKAFWHWEITTDEAVFRASNDPEQRFRLAQRGRYVNIGYSDNLPDYFVETVDATIQNFIEEKVCDAYDNRISNLSKVDGKAAVDVAHNLVERYPESETAVHIFLETTRALKMPHRARRMCDTYRERMAALWGISVAEVELSPQLEYWCNHASEEEKAEADHIRNTIWPESGKPKP